MVDLYVLQQLWLICVASPLAACTQHVSHTSKPHVPNTTPFSILFHTPIAPLDMHTREEDGLVLSLGLLERLLPPGVPVHGVARVLQQVGRLLLGQTVQSPRLALPRTTGHPSLDAGQKGTR